MRQLVAFSAFCAVLAFTGACSNETRSSQDRLAEETREAADAAGEYAAAASREGAEEIRMRLDQLEAKTKGLRARADQAGEEVKAAAEDGIVSVESVAAELRRELREFGAASQQEWNEFTNKARAELDRIERRYDEIEVELK